MCRRTQSVDVLMLAARRTDVPSLTVLRCIACTCR